MNGLEIRNKKLERVGNGNFLNIYIKRKTNYDKRNKTE